jgi:hypothetical protein
MGWFKKITNRRTLHRQGGSLKLESLEQRNLLAGDVMVSVSSSGDLLVTGDAEANSVLIATGDEGVAIFGLDETDIVWNGESAPFQNVVLPETIAEIRDFRIDMQNGDDTVHVEDVEINRSLKVLLRQGNDSVTMENISVGLHASIANGAGLDSIALDSVFVGERLAVNAAENSFEFDATELNVGTNLVFNAAEGNDSVRISRSQISGELVSNNTAGYDHIDLQDSSLYSVAAVGGADFDGLSLYQVEVDQDLSFSANGSSYFTAVETEILGDVSLVGGSLFGSTQLHGSYVGGDLDVSGGEDGDEFRLGVGSAVEGDVAVSLFAGGDTVWIGADHIGGNTGVVEGGGARIGGDVSLSFGEGSDSGFVRNAEISGDFQSTNVEGPGHIELSYSELEGNLVVTGGTTEDTVRLQFSQVDGNVGFDSGEGSSYFGTVAADVSGDVTIQGGDGYNTARVEYYSSIGGNFSFTGGESEDNLTVSYVSYVAGDLMVSLLSGNDRVEISGPNFEYFYGETSVQGDVLIDLAGGADQLELYRAEFPQQVTISTGSGDDVVDLGSLNSYQEELSGSFNIQTGSSDDTVSIDHVFADALDVNLGTASLVDDLPMEDAERLLIENSEFADVELRGLVGHRSVQISNAFMQDLALQTSFGDDAIDLANVAAEYVELRTGSGQDSVRISDEVDFDELEVALGSGEDEFSLSSNSSIGAASTINGGTGQDLASVINHDGLPLISFENVLTSLPAPLTVQSLSPSGSILPSSFSGELESTNVVWFALQVDVGGEVGVSASQSMGMNLVEARAVALYDADGDLLDHSEESGNLNLFLQPGSYFIAVAASSATFDDGFDVDVDVPFEGQLDVFVSTLDVT